MIDAARENRLADVNAVVPAAALAAPFAARARAVAEATLHWASQPGNHLLTLNDAAYPTELKEIADPPVLLHAQGDLSLLDGWNAKCNAAGNAVGIVGSRKATMQGMANARNFARTLSEAGVTIVSGLALGIDAAAHQGGLAGAGSTVAVVGTGIDVIYPESNAALAARIRDAGCLLSEFALGTSARKQYFPIRNRIISGLSRGVLVVEATEKSGSLITARLANEQGRDVFAIPGSIHSALSKGCHKLIRDGARLVDTAHDILEAFGIRKAASETVMLEELTAAADVLLTALTYDPVPADELAARLKLDPADTQASLLALELAGVVERLPGGVFQRLKR
ncbi:DNA-processing protein DprA [Pseudoduganella lutea]|uniref:DNA-processing protein DprA n=1 Tax=Pseudoduganella lutea TaxID=321985 RepID=UPI001E2CA260|nr:DNA-processing protein DprA [Pseudoduganella lutea]